MEKRVYLFMCFFHVLQHGIDTSAVDHRVYHQARSQGGFLDLYIFFKLLIDFVTMISTPSGKFYFRRIRLYFKIFRFKYFQKFRFLYIDLSTWLTHILLWAFLVKVNTESITNPWNSQRVVLIHLSVSVIVF